MSAEPPVDKDVLSRRRHLVAWALIALGATIGAFVAGAATDDKWGYYALALLVGFPYVLIAVVLWSDRPPPLTRLVRRIRQRRLAKISH